MKILKSLCALLCVASTALYNLVLSVNQKIIISLDALVMQYESVSNMLLCIVMEQVNSQMIRVQKACKLGQ